MMFSIRNLVVTLGLCLSTSTFAQRQADQKPVVIIEPEKTVANVQAAAIDTEHFELGPYLGMLSVEDFNSNPVYGVSFTYHINSHWLSQASYGTSKVSRAAFEYTSGFLFLDGSDLNYNELKILGGYKLFDGRSFFWKRHKYNSAIYLMAGIADIQFAGNRNQGLSFGLNYKTVFTDWLVVNLDLSDTVVNLELFDDHKQSHNTAVTFGFNFLF